jgi:hypothetical protein
VICFDCGVEYREVFKAGRLQQLNKADDKPHWQTCRALRGRNAGSVTKALLRRYSAPAKTITGPGYRPACGGCDVPPWIECACSFTAEDLASHRVNMEIANRLAILQPELNLLA